jgi:hypothetical protein
MRILLANHDMEYPGGTQTWIRMMRAELLLRGFEVDVHVHRGGLPVGWSAYRPAVSYDLGLINHHPAFRDLRHARIRRRILTCHGVLPDEERPVLGADAYVAVSEAAQARIPLRSTVIRNPVDPGRFSSTEPPSLELKRVAFVSNRQGAARAIIEEACALAGLELQVIGREDSVADPERIYNWADLVIGIARTAMEALACGRNVMAFDYRGFHGMVTEESLDAMYLHNFGGHAEGIWPSASSVVEEFGKYDPTRNLSRHILDAQSPPAIVDRYLDVARTSRRKVVPSLVRRGPRQLTSPRLAEVLGMTRGRRR